MAALQFEIKKGRAVWKDEYLVHQELAELYELDQSEEKEFAARLMTVVYMIADEESSLRNMVESVKWQYAINNCQITTEELDLARSYLEEAIGLYSYLNNTAEYRSIQSLERVLNSLNNQLADITPSAISVRKKINVGTKDDPQYEEIEQSKDNYDDIQRLTNLIDDTRSKLTKMKDEYSKSKAAGTLRADKEPGGLAIRKLTNPALNQNFKR